MADRDGSVLDDAEGAARVFKALSDVSRLRFLEAIAAHPDICACELLESLELSQSTLSHHMRILCDAGLVSCERNGKWAHYVLSPDGAALPAATSTASGHDRVTGAGAFVPLAREEGPRPG